VMPITLPNSGSHVSSRGVLVWFWVWGALSVPESCLAWTPYHVDSFLDYLDLSCCGLVLFAMMCVCGPVVVAEYLLRHPLSCMKQNGGTA